MPTVFTHAANIRTVLQKSRAELHRLTIAANAAEKEIANAQEREAEMQSQYEATRQKLNDAIQSGRPESEQDQIRTKLAEIRNTIVGTMTERVEHARQALMGARDSRMAQVTFINQQLKEARITHPQIAAEFDALFTADREQAAAANQVKDDAAFEGMAKPTGPTIRIKLLTSMANAFHAYRIGEVIDWPEHEARRLMDRDAAVRVPQNTPLGVVTDPLYGMTREAVLA